MPADPVDPIALPGRGRLIVAFSGGPDSVCLLHRLIRSGCAREIVCVHIDHGLDPASGERASMAAAIAGEMGVECRVLRVEVGKRRGPEAAARHARYAALEAQMRTEETLVTAHHADDQTETVLLRLIRGAGPDGLAGIPPTRRFGPGWLTRPLLEWTRSDIEDWLQAHRLACIRDPANECLEFDRNHLRHELLPALRQRWPGVDASVRKSARLCRGAADLLADLIDRDLVDAETGEGVLRLDRLRHDGDYYRGAAIRAWCIRQSVEPPAGRRLDAFLAQLSGAAGDRCPELRWDDAVLRYWDTRLWLELGENPPLDWRLDWDGIDPLLLPAGLGRLELVGTRGSPLPLVVRSGRPGEALKPSGDSHHRDCKRLLAEAGVPPWQRSRWPRVYMQDRLVALGARWLSAEFEALLHEREQSLRWEADSRRRAAAGLESKP